MENYIVSARKYRPMTFDSVIGQSALTVTLKNAIKSGKLAHAYLFCGPRGVGKTTCARIFAKTINCLSPKENGEACNECESCKAFNEQRSFNIHELDAASNNSVEDIRTLIEQVRIPPQIGKYKVFIIDEVHMLSTAAFNAFLKTLEEPPHHAIFILATTEKHKLLPTILSRCQIYDFNRMKVDDIVAHLANVASKEGISSEPAALSIIAQKADGGMRDALSIFDQVASFCGGNITYQRTIETLNVLDYDYYFKFMDFFLENKITECMLTLNEILSKGFDGHHFINGLASHLRSLLMAHDEQTVNLIETSDDVRKQYAEQAKKCPAKFLYTAMKLCSDCDLNYKNSQNKRLLVELTLIQIAQTAQGEDVPGSGRSPRKILKPIFQQLAANNARTATPAATAAGTTANAPAGANQTVAANNGTAPAGAAEPTGAAAMPAAHPVAPLSPGKASSRPTSSYGFSIRSMKNPGTQQQATASATQVADNEPQMEEMRTPVESVVQIIVAIKEFANTLPREETAMAMRLEALQPTLLEGNEEFEIIADNPNVEEQLNKYVRSIETFVRTRLRNSHIKMHVRLRIETDTKRTLSKLEQVREMCKQNQAFHKLVNEFSLELE